MKHSVYLLVALSFLFSGCQLLSYTPSQIKPTQLVNPYMGTESVYAFSTGNTYPAVAVPWGMHTWTPQTALQNTDGWTYNYSHFQLTGLKQTHQPSPWINDYGAFSLLPASGAFEGYSPAARASLFTHKAEEVTPYSYRVYLGRYDIEARFAPTSRACIFDFRYPAADTASLFIDSFTAHCEVLRMANDHTLMGYSSYNHGGVPENFRNYFVLETSVPIASLQQENGIARAILELPQQTGYCHVTVRVASSFISHEQALLNMERELGSYTLEEIAQQGEQAWNNVLGRVEIAGGTLEQQRTFYTCLYRSLLFPRSFYEYNAQNQVVHYSPYNGTVAPGYLYTDTGFWDTFRALFPLLDLLYPSENLKMQAGLVNAYRESGFLPEWASPGHRNCMVGNNSASVVTGAYLKRLNWLADSLHRSVAYPTDSALIGYPIDELYAALVHASQHVHPHVASTGRLGHEYYNTLGYIPSDVGINESVARTLEYAYNDWCNAQLAKALGRPQEEIDCFTERSGNYRHVFDPSTRLMRGKLANGTFRSPFSPYKWGGDFTEGNAWHYTWSVFHNIPDLVELMGGKDGFTQMLDSLFIVPPIYDDSYYGIPIHEIQEMVAINWGNYAHGNQPIQHVIYLYNYTNTPEKAGLLAHRVMNQLYKPTPDGYCGDEDNGQTSAWYVFSALGFYPVCPAGDTYETGQPLFDRATLHLENGKKVVIEKGRNGKPVFNKKAPKELTHKWLISR